jgi:hypothetical protein
MAARAVLRAASRRGPDMSRYLIATLIFVTSFLSFAHLTQRTEGNPQVITRLALTLSIIEERRLTIDRFGELTIDKAVVDGHVYADKVPGLSLLAIPAVAAARALWLARGETRPSTEPYLLLQYTAIAVISTVSLLGALATAMLYLTALRLGAEHQGAVFGAFALSFGTPFLGWATTFFAHAATGSLLLIALSLIVRDGGRSFARFGIGLLLGLTLVVDLTAAPAVAILGLLFVWRTRDLRTILLAGAGGIVGLAPLLIYNTLAFGSPLKLGYSAVVGFEGMQQGFFGIGVPNPGVLLELLLGLYRGLLPLSPILILVPIGLWVMARRDLTAIVVANALVVVSYLWINASYYYWDGGSSTGPRHLVPMLPLAALALSFAWPRDGRRRGVVIVLQAVSLVVSVICASTDMFNPATFANPFFDRLLPFFVLPENLLRAAPILASWAVMTWLFFVTPRDQERSATS